MKTISGCLWMAVYHKLKDWNGVKIKTIRNRCGRLHWIWIKDGKCYEFYAQGRASKPYWQNLLYFGEVREIKYLAREKINE